MLGVFSQYVSIKGFLLQIPEAFVIGLCLVIAAKKRFWGNPAELARNVAWPDFEVQLLRAEQSLGAASLLLGLFYFSFTNMMLPRCVFLIGMLLLGVFLGFDRRLVDKVCQVSAAVQRVAILGTGPQALENTLRVDSPHGSESAPRRILERQLLKLRADFWFSGDWLWTMSRIFDLAIIFKPIRIVTGGKGAR